MGLLVKLGIKKESDEREAERKKLCDNARKRDLCNGHCESCQWGRKVE